ncbi:cytosine methyltransferase [Sulfuricaulis limicola]|uniref:Cytosine-specific methyltransferase n=1 Tax=Sulfuricaulis limicola TaxID=1620215 RepID=A0A1B4XCM7_9GAMM|nr:DNA cytosine methyltransferase [Sulfuricaulis limicola]BAV32583.1 cytosine methyltransferase [Sulfuricaulis limicola]
MPAKKQKDGRKKIQKAPRAIDLFCGCGGLTLGIKQAGFNVVGAVEIDSLAVQTYKVNHPEVQVWHKDIRKLTSPQILKALGLKRGELDLLAGCPPCQGFSAIRRLNGGRRIRDEQNDLIFEFLRLVRGLRPKAIMMENVPGLADNARLPKLKSALRQLGYIVNVKVKDTRNFGVPQRRRRLILLAGYGAEIPFAAPARRIHTVGETFAKLGKRRAKRDVLHNLPEQRSEKVKQLIRLIPKDGGSRIDLDKKWQLECHRKCDGFSDVYGRMKWNDVAPTITGGCCNPSKGRFLHPTRNRSITLREAALLQSFPPDYYFSLERGKYPAAQMIGNALPPEFIRRHATQIARVLKRLS